MSTPTPPDLGNQGTPHGGFLRGASKSSIPRTRRTRFQNIFRNRAALRKKIKENTIQGPSRDSCWVWTGDTSGADYCVLRLGHRTISAPRLSWMIYVGVLPGGHVVGHACGCTSCVNPRHLVAGTPTEIGKLSQRLKPPAPRGAAHAQAKLTESQVRAIHAMKANGVRVKAIAAEFGMSLGGIEKILYGERWRHARPSFTADTV